MCSICNVHTNKEMTVSESSLSVCLFIYEESAQKAKVVYLAQVTALYGSCEVTYHAIINLSSIECTEYL